MIQTSPDADTLRSQIDTVVFNMDGVLLDTSQSIRQVACLSIPFYLREILHWPAPDDLLTSEDIQRFKNAGGFGDDLNLAFALVLHYLVKGHENPETNPDTLNILQPTLARYASRIGDLGGGLKAAEKILLSSLSRDDQFTIEIDYRKPTIRKVFEELLAGENCQRLYHYTPEYYHGSGYINNDRPLLDLNLIPKNKNIAVHTERTYTEARFGLETCHLDTVIPDASLVTRHDGFRKSDAAGLALLAERFDSQVALYIGDTLDDLATVRTYNRGKHTTKYLSALVTSGPDGAANERVFRTSGADIFASDVNAILEWLNQA